MTFDTLMTLLGILAGIVIFAEVLSFLRRVPQELKRIADALEKEASDG